MFEKLKRRSIKKHTEKYLARRDRSQVNAKLVTLGFVVDEALRQDFEPLYDFAAQLDIQRKDISVFSFLEVKRKVPSMRQNQVNNKHFTWQGAINNQDAEEFLARKFDVLVGLYEGHHPFLDLMVSKSQAKFKVGFQGCDERLFDLTMALSPREISPFKRELKKYLKILNKIA
jgi:hypothetical protein